jgi:putative serine protease PepD
MTTTAPPTDDTDPPVDPRPGGAPARRRRGVGLAAGVLAASVVVGGGAGYGGAALWEARHGDVSSGTPTGVSAASTSTRVGWVEQVAANVMPSVVKIDVRGSQGESSGSGIILSGDGRILTNDHVVAMAARGGDVRVSFDDGERAPAEVLGTDPLTDTAVIRAEGVTGLSPATIGSSDALAVGEDVVAIGSPFGLESTVTSGIVSALDRPVNVAQQADGSSTTYPAIQTDAAINPGNSGGPLVNADGEVVGINSSIRSAASSSPFGAGGAGSIGLGFAIPIDEVMPVVEQMSNGEQPTHARMGVSVTDAEGPDGATGAGVTAVSDGTAATEAGLRRGDVVTRVDDTPVTGADSLVATIRSYRPGDTVRVTFVRDGEEQTVELDLESDAD